MALLQLSVDLCSETEHRSYPLLLIDEQEDEPHLLSKAILTHLQQQEKEEFCLAPPPTQETVHPPRRESGHAECSARLPLPPMSGNYYHSDPMSREPTLMFSLEEPQPLREPVENTDLFQGKMTFPLRK